MTALPPSPPPISLTSDNSQAGSGPGWSTSTPTPEQLQKGLTELERTVQGQIAEEVSIRNSNASFNPQNETTQLLIAACEKLVVEKEAMDRENFEEHTSELPFLCRHFNTTVEGGLSERVYKEKLAAVAPVAGGSKPKRRRRVFALCCQLEFPPQQTWWLDITRRLVPSFQVLRAGKLVACAATEIVQGDIVYLQAGQRAAADGRVLVHSEGTAIDVGRLSEPGQDMRVCSVEASAVPITASSNIVLKDSYLVRGALFCMVVRTPVNPFIPSPMGFNSHPEEPDKEFRVEMSVPPGMSAKSCRNLFKALCIKARLPCRSFAVIAQLANVRALVVLLTQELLDKGTLPQLGATARRLNKRLFLVDCGCRKEQLEELAKELQLEVMTFIEDPKFEDQASDASGAMSIDGYSVDAPAPPPRISTNEAERVRTLGQSTVAGAILCNISQGGLTNLCAILKENSQVPLYAMGCFHYPACFKTFFDHRLKYITNSSSVGTASMESQSFPGAPKASVLHASASEGSTVTKKASSEAGEAQSIVPPGGKHEVATGSTTAADTSRIRSPAAEVSGPGQSRVSGRSMASADSRPMSHQSSRAHTPLHHGDLDLTGISHLHRPSKLVDVLVSVNSIGIVSEIADCVVLKSDLGCLAQALEIACKGVPQEARDTITSEG
jgi:hypothetical protein